MEKLLPLISALIGALLYSQVIYGECQCKNGCCCWLQRTQMEKLPTASPHKKPDEDQPIVVRSYKINCPKCITSMKEIMKCAPITDITHQNVKNLFDIHNAHGQCRQWKETMRKIPT